MRLLPASGKQLLCRGQALWSASMGQDHRWPFTTSCFMYRRSAHGAAPGISQGLGHSVRPWYTRVPGSMGSGGRSSPLPLHSMGSPSTLTGSQCWVLGWPCQAPAPSHWPLVHPQKSQGESSLLLLLLLWLLLLPPNGAAPLAQVR